MKLKIEDANHAHVPCLSCVDQPWWCSNVCPQGQELRFTGLVWGEIILGKQTNKKRH